MNLDEIRITDETGAQKCAKLAQIHLVPMDALLLLLEHYGKGERKYPTGADYKPNYTKGYKWSLSFNAMIRHAFRAWSGEDYDKETGSLHWIAVAWHALTLAHYFITKKGTDDRWEPLYDRLHELACVTNKEPAVRSGDINVASLGSLNNSGPEVTL